MSSTPYGPMQGVADTLSALPGKLDRALPTPPPWFYKMLGYPDPNPVVDPSWHAGMVDAANKSFQPQQAPAPALPPRRKMPTP